MSSSDSNNVCQQSHSTIQDVVEAWKKVTPSVGKLNEAIGVHHQSCIGLCHAENQLQEAERGIQDVGLSVQERIIKFFRGQTGPEANKVAEARDRDRVMKIDLLKSLVDTCAEKVSANSPPILDALQEIAHAATRAHNVTKTCAKPIRDQFMSKISVVVATGITVTDMVSLLRSGEEILGKGSDEAESLLQKARKIWVASTRDRLMSATSTESTADVTIDTIKNLFPLLQAWNELYKKSAYAEGFLKKKVNVRYTKITDPDDKLDYYADEQPRYSLINDIQPVITEVIKAAEEVAKLSSPSPSKPDTQDNIKKM
jgi:preprotein translocase subunit Sss1